MPIYYIALCYLLETPIYTDYICTSSYHGHNGRRYNAAQAQSYKSVKNNCFELKWGILGLHPKWHKTS